MKPFSFMFMPVSINRVLLRSVIVSEKEFIATHTVKNTYTGGVVYFLCNPDSDTPPSFYRNACHPECNPGSFLLKIKISKIDPAGVESRDLRLLAMTCIEPDSNYISVKLTFPLGQIFMRQHPLPAASAGG